MKVLYYYRGPEYNLMPVVSLSHSHFHLTLPDLKAQPSKINGCFRALLLSINKNVHRKYDQIQQNPPNLTAINAGLRPCTYSINMILLHQQV